MTVRSLPPMERTFTLKTKGADTGHLYEGEFTFKRPNLGKQSEIEKTRARLNSDVKGLDEDVLLLHKMWATLKHVIVNQPEWWVKSDYGYELHDFNVVAELYIAWKDFDDEWKKQVWETDEAQTAKEEKKAKK